MKPSMNTPIKIIRLSEVLNVLPLSRTTMYLKVKNGLLPPAISLGEKAVGYIEHEYQTVLASMIAGDSEDEIKELVKTLINDRQKLKQGLTHASC